LHHIFTRFGWLLLLLIPAGRQAVAQENWDLKLTDGSILLSVRDHLILDGQGRPMFNMRGNIIFFGNGQANEDMAYLVRGRNLFARETGIVYDPSMEQALFSMRKGRFYLGGDLDPNRLLFRVKGNGEYIFGIFDGLTDSLLAEVEGRGWTNVNLVAALILLNNYYRQDSVVIAERPDISLYADEGEVIGMIRPAWRDDFLQEWTWNGHVLKPFWGNRPEDEWTFDGKYLRPYWGFDRMEEWAWDGEFLKPAWNNDPKFIYQWDGELLRPFWEYRQSEEWVIEDGNARPKWSTDPNREWIIEGEVPLPVIALVILGFADR